MVGVPVSPNSFFPALFPPKTRPDLAPARKMAKGSETNEVEN